MKYDPYRCFEPTGRKQFQGWCNSMYVDFSLFHSYACACTHVCARNACAHVMHVRIQKRISQSGYYSLFIPCSSIFSLSLSLSLPPPSAFLSHVAIKLYTIPSERTEYIKYYQRFAPTQFNLPPFCQRYCTAVISRQANYFR